MPRRLAILDRYMLLELSGPFGFGLAAFTLIFAASELLVIGRLVATEHAPLWAAIEIFLWRLPAEMGFVLPMALLLGTLLAIQRLSGESEHVDESRGISFIRVTVPLLVAGFDVNRYVGRLRSRRAVCGRSSREHRRQCAWKRSVFNRDLTVAAPLPGGGKQVTIATSFDKNSQALLHVTIVQYDKDDRPVQMIFADRADFASEKWQLENASFYHSIKMERCSPNRRSHSKTSSSAKSRPILVKRISQKRSGEYESFDDCDDRAFGAAHADGAA